MLHPERIVAAWLRSGVPLLETNPGRPEIKSHSLPEAALQVPILCNVGTKEGVTEKNNQFASVWPANELFFNTVRSKGGLIGVAVDPLSSHDCGNQRYMAIVWLDACLTIRLPQTVGEPLKPTCPLSLPGWVPIAGSTAVSAATFADDPISTGWLPNAATAQAWMQYVKDTNLDDTPPLKPTRVRVNGHELTWQAEADVESGLASFIIERDGQFPRQRSGTSPRNLIGRPGSKNLQYSDTPTQLLVPMQFKDLKAESDKRHVYRVIAVNTVGLKSTPAEPAVNE